MKRIVEVAGQKREFCVGQLGDCFADYSDGYIDDIVMEIADAHVSIYYSDIKNFIVDNFDYFEEAIKEGMYGVKEFDIYKYGQLAEFMKNEAVIYEHLSDSLKYWTITRLGDTITPEMLERIDEMNPCEFDRLEELVEEFIYEE